MKIRDSDRDRSHIRDGGDGFICFWLALLLHCYVCCSLVSKLPVYLQRIVGMKIVKFWLPMMWRGE